MKALIVEDDKYYGHVVAECLADRGLTIRLACSAQDALACDLAGQDVAVVDVMLPNDPSRTGISEVESRGGFATGIALARRMKQKAPDLKLVLLTSAVSNTDVEGWAGEHGIPFVRKADGEAALILALGQLGIVGAGSTPKAFIVHGRDDQSVLDLKAYITGSLLWQSPVILRDEPSSGRTIIEKFEEYASKVDCVFVLLAGEDEVASAADNETKRRSRQNVIFELGFFYAQFGRHSGRILLLHKGPVEIPTDMAGLVWIDIENGITGADQLIRREVAKLAGTGTWCQESEVRLPPSVA